MATILDAINGNCSNLHPVWVKFFAISSRGFLDTFKELIYINECTPKDIERWMKRRYKGRAFILISIED